MCKLERVAQLDRALGYGPRGWGFKSSHARFLFSKFMKNIFLKKLVYSFVILLVSMSFIDIDTFAVGPGDMGTTATKKIAVVGDSYSYWFQKNFGDDEFEYSLFTVPAIDKENNVILFTDLINNGNNDFILFATGVNDYLLDTKLDVFEETIRTYAKLAEEKKKYLILHTYMHFPKDRVHPNPVSIEQYDAVLRKIDEEYDSVYYIDMSNFNHDRYCIDDGMHFDVLFYKTLYAKLKYLTDNINFGTYNIESPWLSTAKNDRIAVTGDSYAGTFARLEGNKSYIMYEFAKDGRTIIENTDLINAAISSDAKYVLISTSVNDYEKQTPLIDFEDKLREFLNNACINHKIVFFHTYMEYGAAKTHNVVIRSYDDTIKKMAKEYPITVYVDTIMYQDEVYQMPDKTHYGTEFNDYLYSVIDEFIKAFNAM